MASPSLPRRRPARRGRSGFPGSAGARLAAALVAAWLAPAPARATGQWTDVPSPVGVSLAAVKFTNRIDAWAVGLDGTVLRYLRGTWSNYPSGSDKNLKAVTVLPDGTAWAAGENGALVHMVNGLWSPDPQGGVITLLTLRAVAFLNPDNGWAVGGDAGLGGVILRYVSGAWVTATQTIDPIESVAIIGSDNVWFCGWNRRLERFDGTTFIQNFDIPSDGLAWHALAFPYQGIGWVAGDAGWIGNRRAGVWSIHAQGSSLATSSSLLACSFLADDGSGYVVGQQGTRIHYDGSAFTLEARGGEDLASVDLPNTLEGAAVGGVAGSRIVMLRALTAEAALNNVRVFPNPFDSNSGVLLTFDRLPNDVSSLALYTLKGERVADLTHGIDYAPAVGVATWNGRIFNAYSAASGSYLYRIATRSGKKVQGVFLVTRR